MPYIITILVAVVLGVGFTLFQSNKTASVSEPTPITQTTPTNVVVNFKDGTYNADATYRTPVMSKYKINVALQVTDGVVTNSTATYADGAEKDPNAKHFEEAYKTEVVGKKLNDINLSRVGGASLTTGAFNQALTVIKTQAQS